MDCPGKNGRVCLLALILDKSEVHSVDMAERVDVGALMPQNNRDRLSQRLDWTGTGFSPPH